MPRILVIRRRASLACLTRRSKEILQIRYRYPGPICQYLGLVIALILRRYDGFDIPLDAGARPSQFTSTPLGIGEERFVSVDPSRPTTLKTGGETCRKPQSPLSF